MTADEVIELRKLWASYTYGPHLPESTVLATSDWLAYVQAMAEAMPKSEVITYPTQQDVLWAWPEGVAIIFDEPFSITHTIISSARLTVFGMQTVDEVPHFETQVVAGVAFSRLQPTPTKSTDGTEYAPMESIPIVWIGADPSDAISGHWLPDGLTHAQKETGEISESTRMMISVVTALGHRLTRIEEPTIVGGRGERRRVQRELPSLRVLRLGTGATVSARHESSTVEWTKRWMVRGHWRLQPYGPVGQKTHKPIWIDPYVKGPEDKPLDVRPTVWKTAAPE